MCSCCVVLESNSHEKPSPHSIDCNSKVLGLFERNSLGTSLDLSDFDLRPEDSAPLFQALQSQQKLSVLKLAGNRCLKDKAMKYLLSALGAVPTLRELDLSSTGITHQVSYTGGIKLEKFVATAT